MLAGSTEEVDERLQWAREGASLFKKVCADSTWPYLASADSTRQDPLDKDDLLTYKASRYTMRHSNRSDECK
jgi:hypothetical protein